MIETDSVVMRRKLAATRADRSNPIKQFNVLWLAEEAEHGRALSAAAERLGVRLRSPEKRPMLRDLRSVTTWPALYVSGALIPYLDAAYCVLGSLQEYIALTTYRRIAVRVGDEALYGLLHDIARQEGRHMRFYAESAKVLLSEPSARWVTVTLINHLWRPPGVDLLGLEKWLNVFRPLFDDHEYVSNLLRVDQILGKLTHYAEVRPMRRFIEAAMPEKLQSGREL
ncbi:ferritin-like domain-containing protein [Streptomyces sp. NPDC097107]|uniref:ferritin-like domain-containing protein n=1 Tax=Streptomyces sp. NPDC097107 TaxID=3366089 RepID=UPI0037F97357